MAHQHQYGRHLAASALVLGLVVNTALVATMTSGSGRMVALAALMLAALAGQALRDWREALSVGLAASALVAWCTSSAGQVTAPALTTLCIVLNTSIAAWNRTRTVPALAPCPPHVTPRRMLALPAPRAALQPMSGRPYIGVEATDSPLLREAGVVLQHIHPEPAAPERHQRVA